MKNETEDTSAISYLWKLKCKTEIHTQYHTLFWKYVLIPKTLCIVVIIFLTFDTNYGYLPFEGHILNMRFIGETSFYLKIGIFSKRVVQIPQYYTELCVRTYLTHFRFVFAPTSRTPLRMEYLNLWSGH